MANNLVIKNIDVGDIEALYQLEAVAWGNMAASKAELERRIKCVPNCTYGYYINGQLVGNITCVEVKYDIKSEKKWTDYLTCFHKKEEGANCLYIISFSALPNAPYGTGRQLLKFAYNLCKERNLHYLAYGARVPAYKKYSNKMNIEKYVEQVKQGNIIDPVLSLANILGFNIGQIVENYFQDEESLNYGVMVYKEIGSKGSSI